MRNYEIKIRHNVEQNHTYMRKEEFGVNHITQLKITEDEINMNVYAWSARNEMISCPEMENVILVDCIELVFECGDAK